MNRHFGNPGDLLKHAVLCELIARLDDVDLYVETHAGAPAYWLAGPEQRYTDFCQLAGVGDLSRYLNAVGQAAEVYHKNPSLPVTAPYGHGTTVYPGSPVLAMLACPRPAQLVFFEIDARDRTGLLAWARSMRSEREVRVPETADGVADAWHLLAEYRRSGTLASRPLVLVDPFSPWGTEFAAHGGDAYRYCRSLAADMGARVLLWFYISRRIHPTNAACSTPAFGLMWWGFTMQESAYLEQLTERCLSFIDRLPLESAVGERPAPRPTDVRTRSRGDRLIAADGDTGTKGPLPSVTVRPRGEPPNRTSYPVDATRTYLGVDLAWGSSEDSGNETGVVMLDTDRANARPTISDAGWTVGLRQTQQWIERCAGESQTVLMIDAPLVVCNNTGQRQCEREVAVRFGRAKVAANSTNAGSPNKAGVVLLERLIDNSWFYVTEVTPRVPRWRVSECYPYCTIVGASELGYTVRPTYKRRPKGKETALASVDQWRKVRAAAFADLARRLNEVVDLTSHPSTATLLEEAPLLDREYKHREDLLDAVLCAWTGVLFDAGRCIALGGDDPLRRDLPSGNAPAPAVIIAPIPG